jgi:CarD family transcriptional regulator
MAGRIVFLFKAHLGSLFYDCYISVFTGYSNYLRCFHPGKQKGYKNIMASKSDNHLFAVDDYIVYPKHGVGRIIELETQDIAGISLELYVISFEKERMTLRVPTNKAESSGMRRLSSAATLKEAFTTLKGKARIKRTMWSRRAQEYEAKINSGDLVSIAEVVRDLHRSSDQPEQSYSERQIYEAALGRLARELAAVEEIDEEAAIVKLEAELAA